MRAEARVPIQIKCKYLQKSVDSVLEMFFTEVAGGDWRVTNCRREQEGSRQKSTQVESVTEGRHRKRFVAHRGRRDSVRGAEGESHFRRLRNSNKKAEQPLCFFWLQLIWRSAASIFRYERDIPAGFQYLQSVGSSNISSTCRLRLNKPERDGNKKFISAWVFEHDTAGVTKFTGN